MSNPSYLPTVTSFSDIEKFAGAFTKSGFFADAKDMSQAVVKIMAGAEMGIPPFAAMTGIHIIKGKPSVGAGLMASTLRNSGKYDYKVLELSTKICKIKFLRGGEDLGTSEITIEELQKAGSQNLGAYPRNMLFARAMSNGVKWYCPDLLQMSVYDPDELGAKVDSEGNYVVDINHEEVKSAPKKEAKVVDMPIEVVDAAEPKATGKQIATITGQMNHPKLPADIKAKTEEWLQADHTEEQAQKMISRLQKIINEQTLAAVAPTTTVPASVVPAEFQNEAEKEAAKEENSLDKSLDDLGFL